MTDDNLEVESDEDQIRVEMNYHPTLLWESILASGKFTSHDGSHGSRTNRIEKFKSKWS